MTEQETATDYLKGIQRSYLMKRYGMDFEKIIKKRKENESFYDYIEIALNAKQDLTQDQKYELEAQLKSLILETAYLNTEYETPEDWYILFSLFENIKKILPAKTKLPYIGVVSSGDINAEAYAIRDTSIKLILLEGELFTCANLLCKIFAQSIPLSNNDNTSLSFSPHKADLDVHLQNETLTERFNDFFLNSTNHYPSDSDQYLLDKDRIEHLSSLLLDSLEYFIIGHEYGHIHLDHLDTSSLKSVSLNLTNSDLMKINTSWEQEFQADNVGAQIIIEMDEGGYKFPYSVLGPDLLFSFFHYKNIFSSKDKDSVRQESDTHPAPLERKRLVREYILSKYSPKDKEILNKTYNMIDNIMTHHIDNYKKKNY